MSPPLLAKATKAQPASLWKEAQQLNPWLASEDGCEALNDVLPAKWRLASAEHQQVAGALFVDVLARTVTGKSVVLEAQLGQSNHDHLGKLITYCAVYQASAAVWVVADARPEHVEAINLLNQTPVAEFFLVKVEAVSVGDSDPAPLLTLITGPSAEIQTAATVQAGLNRRDALRVAFWEEFLKQAAGADTRFAAKKARPTSRMGVPTQRLGIRYVVGLRQHSCSIELVVMPGRKGKFGPAGPVMAQIEESRSDIENALAGTPIEWLPGTRPRLRITIPGGGYGDQSAWPQVRSNTVSTLKRLMKATAPALTKLTSRPPVGDGAQEEEEDEEEIGGEEG